MSGNQNDVESHGGGESTKSNHGVKEENIENWLPISTSKTAK